MMVTGRASRLLCGDAPRSSRGGVLAEFETNLFPTMTMYPSLRHLAAGLLAVLLCGLLAETAAGQYFGRNKVVYERFDWQQIQTEHFDVYYYPAKEEAIRDKARMAERWYDRLRTIFQHEFDERKPLIFYADDTDFQQTNVIGGFIGEGTGGVTEGRRDRMIMPFTGSYKETDRILGHELVHVFQFDIWKANAEGFRLGAIPLWFIEGMAEYLSLGRQDAHTAMWMRDAVQADGIPTTRDLTREPRRFFPYRYGQALMAYIGGRWGDGVMGALYRQAGRVGVEGAFQNVLGITGEDLSEDWASRLRETFEEPVAERTPPGEAGERILTRETVGGRLNISPALSPDGRYVAFFSERGLFSVDLFVADAETGEIVRRLTRTGRDAHFDAVRFISSAGTWSPDGTRFAFSTFRQGRNEIAVLNVETRRIERRFRVGEVSAINNPTWGPDGDRIAFVGMSGGLSDLYVLDTDTRDVRQLTNDRHAALHPNWSPDGERLAFATDRGSETSFSRLTFSSKQLALVDVESREVERLSLFEGGKHINPQFAPDGRSLYFAADPDGFSNIYRYALEEDQIYQVTDLSTGVSGIMALSPTLTVARQAERMMFSVFERGGYNVFAKNLADAQGTPVERRDKTPIAAELPPPEGDRPGIVSSYLADASGLPEDETFAAQGYRARLSLDYIGAQGGLNVGYAEGANRLGTQLGGGVIFVWNDLMNDHTMYAIAQANGTFRDLGGVVAYQNKTSRLQWGPSVSHIPQRQGFGRAGFTNVAIGDGTTRPGTFQEQTVDRVFATQAAMNTAYPLSMNERLEASAGYTRLSFHRETERVERIGGRVVRREFTSEVPRSGLNLIDASAAFVGDYSFQGFTSPIDGRRYRFEISSRTGDLTYEGLLADYREYFFVEPVTMAVRGLHFGRYNVIGSDAERITPLHLGQPSLVRGYNYFTYEPQECGDDPGCPAFNRLNGSRLAVLSAEARVPLLGTREFGLIDFPFLPTEVGVFADAGLAWSEGDAPRLQLDRRSDRLDVPVVSAGVNARVNVLGAFVAELMYVFPFQRPDKGWHFDFHISPGW